MSGAGGQNEQVSLAQGDDRLPAWDDWGGFFGKGLMTIVINLLYALPVLLLTCCMLSALATTGAFNNEGYEPSQGMSAFLACLGCLMVPLALLASIIGPVATYRYATTGDMGAAFNFGAVTGLLRERLGAYLVAWLVAVFLLPIVASALSSILCGLPLPWLSFLAGVMGYNLFGQTLSGASPQTTPEFVTPSLPSSF